jgi:hypothetical protein
MRLTDASNKIKSSLRRLVHSPDLPKDTFMALLILLVGSGSFILGRLSAQDAIAKNELSVTRDSRLQASAFQSNSELQAAPNTVKSTPANTAVAGMYVGSKSGKTYHLPWCSGAKRIKEENKIWFQSKDEAAGRGYSPAANCKGI